VSGGEIEFVIYQPDQNYSNDFLQVTKLGVPGTSSIHWDGLALLVHKEEKNDEKRQHKYRDFGTTGVQCTTRVGSVVGVATPSKKPGTNDNRIVEAMLVLSQYTKGADFIWLPKGMRPFNCDDGNDPRNEFGARFHPDCIIPAVQVGLTNQDHPCRFHCDELNSTLLQYELVPALSMIVTINGVRYRCAIIGYNRQSVDEYLVRADVHRTYIEFACHEYDKFDEEQKHLLPTLFSSGVPVRNCIPGFAMLKNLCHLDPWLHYSGFLNSTVHLERKYQLSLQKRLSLLRAMAVTPSSAYMYVAAASSLLQVTHLNDINGKNYQFGLLLANMMVDIYQALVDEKRSLTPQRFSCYAKYRVPEEEEWNKQCDRLLLLHFTTPNTEVKSERRSAYKEVRQSLADIFPYVDVLGGNHVVAIAGVGVRDQTQAWRL
jgi:hypothetical protein